MMKIDKDGWAEMETPGDDLPAAMQNARNAARKAAERSPEFVEALIARKNAEIVGLKADNERLRRRVNWLELVGRAILRDWEAVNEEGALLLEHACNLELFDPTAVVEMDESGLPKQTNALQRVLDAAETKATT